MRPQRFCPAAHQQRQQQRLAVVQPLRLALMCVMKTAQVLAVAAEVL
jgi:hypothetical protein